MLPPNDEPVTYELPAFIPWLSTTFGYPDSLLKDIRDRRKLFGGMLFVDRLLGLCGSTCECFLNIRTPCMAATHMAKEALYNSFRRISTSKCRGFTRVVREHCGAGCGTTAENMLCKYCLEEQNFNQKGLQYLFLCLNVDILFVIRYN